jgi:hypothetical protein
VGVKDVKTGVAYIDASFIVVLFEGVVSCDGEYLLSKVWE